MSILIKGVEIPEDCAMMLKIFPDGRVGVPVHLTWAGTMVMKDAEAVPVPAHGRLIDADALCKTLRSLAENEYTPEVFANWIENHIDTIIPAEEGE